MTSLVGKRSSKHFFGASLKSPARRRQLVLTDFPRILLIDVERMAQIGEIEWSSGLSVHTKGPNLLEIQTVQLDLFHPLVVCVFIYFQLCFALTEWEDTSFWNLGGAPSSFQWWLGEVGQGHHQTAEKRIRRRWLVHERGRKKFVNRIEQERAESRERINLFCCCCML